jgi:hypothetical protein
MIAEALDIARETYFAILLDRMYDGPVKSIKTPLFANFDNNSNFELLGFR